MTDSENHVQWSIEWTYSPADFLGEPQQIRQGQCELSISDGRVVVKVDPACGDPHPTLRDQLDVELRNRFIGAQLVSNKPFELSRPSVYGNKPGGGRIINAEARVGGTSSV